MMVLGPVAVSTSQRVYRNMRLNDDEKRILNNQVAASDGLSEKGKTLHKLWMLDNRLWTTSSKWLLK